MSVATAVAKQMGPAGVDLRDAVGNAYLHGMNTALVAGVVVALVAAALTLVTPPQRMSGVPVQSERPDVRRPDVVQILFRPARSD